MHSDAATASTASTASDPTIADGARIPRTDAYAPDFSPVPPDPVALVETWFAAKRDWHAVKTCYDVNQGLITLLEDTRDRVADFEDQFVLMARMHSKLIKFRLDRLKERAAEMEWAAAKALHESGPREVGAWDCRGEKRGEEWRVVLEAIGVVLDHDERPIVAEACVAIDEVA